MLGKMIIVMYVAVLLHLIDMFFFQLVVSSYCFFHIFMFLSLSSVRATRATAFYNVVQCRSTNHLYTLHIRMTVTSFILNRVVKNKYNRNNAALNA